MSHHVLFNKAKPKYCKLALKKTAKGQVLLYKFSGKDFGSNLVVMYHPAGGGARFPGKRALLDMMRHAGKTGQARKR